MKYFKVSRVNLIAFVTLFVSGASAGFFKEWLLLLVCVFGLIQCFKIAVYERLLDLYNDDRERKRKIINCLKQFTGWEN